MICKMEKEILIETKDKFQIKGILNSSKNATNKLIIFVHGLTGHKNEHLFFNGAKYFSQRNFDTFRFDLYSGDKRARRLLNCTIKTHSRDLETVLNYFKEKYSEIFLVGHSLGGPTILWANHSVVKSVVLWDPAFKILETFSDELQFNKEWGVYVVDWGTEFLLSKEMVEEWRFLDERILSHFVRPTKIICAEKGILEKSWKESLEKISVETAFTSIKNAGHCFDEEGTEEQLFEETLKWFER